MSSFTIPSESLSRFCRILDFFDQDIPEETKRLLKTVRVENANGKTYLIATNQKVAAVEYINDTTEQDSFTHLRYDESLMNLLRDSRRIDLLSISELALSSIKTDNLQSLNDCCIWLLQTPLNQWRDWFINPSTDSESFMCVDVLHLETLVKSAPSNSVVFPKHINAKKPVLLRDVKNPRWAGSFLPQPDVGVTVLDSRLPEWLK